MVEIRVIMSGIAVAMYPAGRSIIVYRNAPPGNEEAGRLSFDDVCKLAAMIEGMEGCSRSETKSGSSLTGRASS